MNERETVITKRHNLRDNLEDLVTFPLLQPLLARGHRVLTTREKMGDLAGFLWADVSEFHRYLSKRF